MISQNSIVSEIKKWSNKQQDEQQRRAFHSLHLPADKKETSHWDTNNNSSWRQSISLEQKWQLLYCIERRVDVMGAMGAESDLSGWCKE